MRDGFSAQPGFPELRTYLNTQVFTTLDGFSSPICECYMNIQGTRWYAALALCLAETGRIIATAGAKESPQTTDGVWPVKVNAKSGRLLYCLYFDHNIWAGRFHRETIQHFDAKRSRPYAPATYFASETGDDYLHELMQEHEVWNNRKTIWEKVSQSAVNDYGDCEKIGLVQDWCARMSRNAPDYLLRAGNQAVPR
jgi:hypothetical protein